MQKNGPNIRSDQGLASALEEERECDATTELINYNSRRGKILSLYI